MSAVRELIEKYRPARRFVSRSIGGDLILVPIAGGVADLESVYTFNETGARMWQLFSAGQSVSEVAAALTAEFEIDRDDAERDAQAFAAELSSAGLLERESS